ncbi:MAG: EamA family transporter [Rhodospirillaceae bacterium]|nr:EamA family transporter [Rhodospirillaceae bacterium]
MIANSFTKVAPIFFVLLWSSAFIGAKFGLPFAEPLTFMFLRFVFVSSLFLFLSLIFKASWPKNWLQVGHIAVVGVLIHALYLNCTFVALSYGAHVAIAALILGLQPALTVLIVSLLPGGHISRFQWLGVFLGLLGLVLVLYDKLELNEANLMPIYILVFGLFCITIGTIYQRRFCSQMDLLTGNFIQVLIGCVISGLAAFSFETMYVLWDIKFIGALLWMIIIVSLGAHTLLLFMLRQNQVATVTSLLYLTPPTAAIMAFFAFDEFLSILAIAGIAVTLFGVSLIVRGGTANKEAL